MRFELDKLNPNQIYLYPESDYDIYILGQLRRIIKDFTCVTWDKDFKHLLSCTVRPTELVSFLVDDSSRKPL
jgi:hypothetical protein